MATTFAEQLRHHRQGAGLTQERLAERAGLSAAGIAALEAGRRRAPRLSTVTLLADALGLGDETRAALAVAAVAATSAAPAAGERPDRSRSTGAHRGNFPGVRGRASFVGRTDDYRRLHDAWRRRVRLVVVAGESGVGKTRLASELGAALEHDTTVLWGRCTPHRIGVYEPFQAPIRALLAEAQDAADLIPRLGRLLPELVVERGWTGDAEFDDPGVEQRLLFDAVATVLGRLGSALLVIDDLQWADEGTLSLLAYVAGDERLAAVTVLCTVRSAEIDDHAAEVLARVRRVASVERIDLVGVDPAAVAEIVSELAGDAGSAALVAAVAGATGGNPLFVEELTEHLVGLGFTAPADGGGSLPVPSGVQDTIGRRVASLGRGAQSLLRAGAVLGRSFDPFLAAQLAGLHGEEVLSAAEDAMLSGLVVEQSAHELSFSHGLVQSAIYALLSGIRRIDLHRRAALALEAAGRSAVDGPTPTYTIAHHWATVAASDPSASARAGTWSLRAGDDATAAADVGEAIVRYRAAVSWFAAPTPERAESLLRLGTALFAHGSRDDADAAFAEAAALGRELDSSTLFARAAIGLASSVTYGHSDPGRIADLDHALAWLPPTEDVLRTMVAAMLKRQLGFDVSEDAYRRRQEAARIVLDAVSQPDLPRELLLTLGGARDAIMVDDPVVLDRLSRRTVAVGEAERRLHVAAHGWYGRAWAALELADADAWHASVEGFTAVAERLALPFEQALAATMAATAALVEGRYDDAVAHGVRAFELGHDVDPNATTIHLTNAVISGIDRGEAAAMVELMASSRAELEQVPTFLAGFAATAALGDAPGLARELLDEFATRGLDSVRRDLEWLPVMGFLAFTAGHLAAAELAPALHGRLAAHPARAIRVGPLAGWWGPVDHHLGALCRLMGQRAQAEAQLRRACDVCVEMRAAPWLARCRLELARIIDLDPAPRGSESDELRSQARAAAVQLGALGIAALADR